MASGFFPLDRHLKIDNEGYSSRTRKQICELTACQDYRDVSAHLKQENIPISHEHIARIVEATGAEIHEELYGPEASVHAATEAPHNAVPLLVLSADGHRYRSNEADRPRRAHSCADKADEADETPQDASVAHPAETAQSDDSESNAHTAHDSGWRENKVGVVIRALPGSYRDDGTYDAPTELVKTYVSSTDDIHAFGRDLRTEAERRGVNRAVNAVIVSDNGHGLPEMFQREFRDLPRVTDYKHTSDRLKECAKLLKPGAHTPLHKKWKRDLWEGRIDKLLDDLIPSAENLASRPRRAADLPEGSPERTLWSHILYIEKYRDTMDYPSYRAKGWPISSATIESACGQMGDRIKHARMRWTRQGANAIALIKAAIYSEDDRWSRRWPPAIPILETDELPAKAAA